ncbi:MAG: acyl-CoA dehydrogenase family protein [Chloroflexi bacterium]|nr:acyl-CoA dehydrogenase family protein [Chloroflexota bacterium]
MKLDELHDFGLTENQKMVRAMARDFAEKEILPKVEAYEREGRYPRDILEKMASLGMLGPTVPEKYGGAGLDYVSYGLICEEIARACWICASVISVQNSLVNSGIVKFGTEEQKQKYLVPLARGEKLASACLTEPGGGSDLASLESTITPDGDDYILNGSKVFISHAQHSSVYFVLASIDRTRKHKGICALLVENPSPGITATPLKLRTLKRGNICEVHFDNVRVPRSNLLGEEGGGFRVVGSNLDIGRFSVAARCVGQAQACVDACLKYANERVQFGQTIGHFQMVQRILADMIVSVEAARLMVYRVGQLKDAGLGRASLEASMAKLMASDVCVKACVDAIQVHGGYGFSEDLPVGRFLMEAKVLQIGEGTNELQRALIAEYALGIRSY